MNYAERRLWEGLLQKQEDRLTCCERAFLRLLRSLQAEDPLAITAVPYATTKNGSAVYRTGRAPLERTQGSYEPTEEIDEP